MKTLIMIHGHDVRIRLVTDLQDAQYQFNRRIEKEGWEADQAYIVDESGKIDTNKWLESYHNNRIKFEKDHIEREERKVYEQLKAKFENEKK